MKDASEKYKQLTEIEHVINRPGMYIGNVGTEDYDGFLYNEETSKMEKKVIQYNPAFLKLFDEIISNSVDESKRDGNLGLDTIRVNIEREDGSIEIIDNGGIPVVIHKEVGIYIPEMLFGSLRSGSNFDDTEDRMTTGTHGLGAVLTNIFSKEFHVTTADGKNRFIQKFSENNHKKTEPKITPITSHYTNIRFLPDYQKLKMTKGLDDMNYARLVKRVVDVAGCNPKLKVYLNGNLIKIRNFQDFVSLYLPKDTEVFYESSEHWEVGITHSPNGDALNVAFINGTETPKGTHIQYITEQIVTRLRQYILKKHKYDMRPGELKNHLYLFINGSVVNPKYSSQTKENLITEIKDFKTAITISEKTIKKILGSEILKSVIDYIEAKKIQEENRQLREANKNASKTSLKGILKFKDASSKDRKNCVLLICEGDSAATPLSANRDPKTMGIFALRGKPLNVHGVTASRLLENVEFKNILSILGLRVGVKVESVDDLYFGKIGIAADQDVDGNHIVGLLINLFTKYWPEVLQMGILHRFMTPIVKAKNSKETLNFYNLDDFRKWQESDPKGYSIRYFKGLGTSENKDFKEYLADLDKHLVPIIRQDLDDDDAVDLAFNGMRADDRKIWLDLL